MSREKRGLECIIHMECCGNSFAWSVMKNISEYTLYNNYNENETWQMEDEYKDYIDGKIESLSRKGKKQNSISWTNGV